jgi:hypothetical protein
MRPDTRPNPAYAVPMRRGVPDAIRACCGDPPPRILGRPAAGTAQGFAGMPGGPCFGRVSRDAKSLSSSRCSPAGMASTQVSVPASWYFRMAACRALTRVLATTTPGRPGATLDSNDQHYPDHRRVRGCHRYRSPDSAGRPAHAGAGRWSRCSSWTLEIPTSSVRSNCSAGHGGLVVPGHPHEWATERGGEWCTCLAPPVGRYASFHAE